MGRLEETIRERAYALWEEAGRPDGRADEHWRQAARELGFDASPGTPEGGEGGRAVPDSTEAEFAQRPPV